MLTPEEGGRLRDALAAMLPSVCDYAHERCGKLLQVSGTAIHGKRWTGVRRDKVLNKRPLQQLVWSCTLMRGVFIRLFSLIVTMLILMLVSEL